MKKLILLKNLPNCPKGRIFKQALNGDFFNSATDWEVTNNKIKSYVFTPKEIEKNKKFFLEVSDEFLTSDDLKGKGFILNEDDDSWA